MVTGRVVAGISEKLDGDIVFDKIHFKPFTTLVLKNAAIIDRNPVSDPLDSTSVRIDTLFHAEYIIARFSLDGLFKHEGIHLNKAFVGNAQMTLVLEDKEDAGDGDTSTDNLSRIFRIRKSEGSSKSEKEIFHINKVEVSDMRFAMKSYQADRHIYAKGGIDWNDLDITNINLNARNLMFKAGIMSGKADKLSFREKSGYKVKAMSGEARVGRGRTIIEDLYINDLWSEVHLPLFMMSYENIDAFNDFISMVRLEASIQPSVLDFETLSYFAPELSGNSLIADVSGHMSGYVDDFGFTDVNIASHDGGFSGKASGRLTGLPDIDKTRMNVRLDRFALTTRGLEDFIAKWMDKEDVPDLSKYAQGTTFILNAKGSGPLNRLKLDAGISSHIGKVKADITIEDMVDKDKPIGIAGLVKTDDIDLGKVLDMNLIGPTTLQTRLEATIGNERHPSEVKFDELEIDRLHVNGYDYSQITANGNISANGFNGLITSHDPNCYMMLSGAFALSSKTKNAKYEFHATVGHIDLNALNIDKRDVSRMNFIAHADFTKANTGNISGWIDIDDLVLENSMGRQKIGNIDLSSLNSGNQYQMRLESGFARGSYVGSAPTGTFVKDLKNIVLKKQLPALFRDSTYVWNGNSYKLDFICDNSMDLLTFIMPGLYIDEGTRISASLDKKGEFKAYVHSNRLAYGKNYLKGIDAELGNGSGKLDGNITCDEIKLSSARLQNNHIQLHGGDNSIGISYDYDNSGNKVNKGELRLRGNLARISERLMLDLEIPSSSVFLNSKEWHIQPSSISVMRNLIDVKSFELTSGDERIRLKGKLSDSPEDTLDLNLDRFDISIANSLLGDNIGIKGAATGTVSIASPIDDKSILVDMLCDSTYLSGCPLGVLTIGSSWDEKGRNFTILLRNELKGRSSIQALGTYKPETKDVHAVAEFDHFRIDYAQPLLSDVFSVMNGELSGNVSLVGTLDDPVLSSTDTRLDNALLKIAYTDVPYQAEGSFHLDNTGVYFDDIQIRDRHTGKGSVNGSINWRNLKDINFNTQIKVDAIEGINLSESAGLGFYGNIFGTGNVAISGPLNNITLSVDAVTAGDGQLHIPVTEISTAGKAANLLRFREIEKHVEIDPYEAMMVKMDAKEKAENDFRIKLRINAQPEVEAFVEIDKASGNVLSGRGSGIINLDVGTDEFRINGDYILNSGNYKFVAMNLVSRDFQIEDGSSIHFNGDLMDSDLNITAIYRTKASLQPLLSDESSVTNKRNVDCKVSITDKLSNFQLGFDITIPDLNPMIQSRVESALSTEDKKQKQFLSLILSNSFLPDEQSGIANNSTLLYSNVTEVLTNQLNNIFHKLDIPLDLGFNYQPNESGNDLFDVAVSTQLFNNRVIVNGNIGNKQYNPGGSQNDVVGDLDIEIKLNRSGAFRLNLFSHSADQFSNYLDNSQRNGVGLMFQTEFNSLGRFIRNIFMRKAKRMDAKMQEEQAMLQGERVEIQLTKEEPKTRHGREDKR